MVETVTQKLLRSALINRTKPGMPTFAENFGFSESPFEQYVAEREPRINEYAVKPPYFEEARRRISGVSSYLLFGFRGSGKSATRITAEKETWKDLSAGRSAPLMITFTDFDQLLASKKVEDVTLSDLVRRAAFLTIESLLLWISNQENPEQYLKNLDADDRRSLIVLANAFYLSLPEGDRELSRDETMRILQQNWTNQTRHWVDKKWTSISKIIAIVTSSFAKSKLQTDDIGDEVADLLARSQDGGSVKTILSRLVEVARAFGFTGICILIDKVDEHAKTQKSTEETAKLVYPIVSQVQMMEVDGFAWIFFLWDKVKAHLSTDKMFARLDKYAHSDVTWPKDFLYEMVSNRLKYFSGEKIVSLSDICELDTDSDLHLNNIISLVQGSPRELIRLLDVITREFNSNYAHLPTKRKLSNYDFDTGQDAYVRDVLWTAYDNKILSQLLRFNTTPFTNKDVQRAFKISFAGARGRIQSWEACGAVNLSGTRAPEGEAGGKPANEYSIADPRILRMAERKLYDPEKLSEAPLDDEES